MLIVYESILPDLIIPMPNFYVQKYNSIISAYSLNYTIYINYIQSFKTMNKFYWTIITVLLSQTVLSRPFQLIKHPFETGARCLEGTPAALYFYEGEEKNKFLLYFEGGGLCSGYTLHETLQDCHQRSKTHLGSSSEYPDVRDFSRFTILSGDDIRNPLYYNWSKVFIPYCDGSMHQGSRLQPSSFENDKLYFRGANNTLAHFSYLDEVYSLFNAQKIVVSGTSAGAVATMMWGNTIYKNAKNKQGVLLIADSGVFISDPKLAPGIKKYAFIGMLANKETSVPIDGCQKLIHECTTAQVLAQLIIPPIIVLQSLYDVYSIRNLLLINCPQNSFPASLQKCTKKELKKIQKHRIQTLRILQKFQKDKKNGVWAISCAQHGFLYDFSYYNSDKYLVPEITGNSVFQFLQDFQNGRLTTNIDDLRWPQNYACNGKLNLVSY